MNIAHIVCRFPPYAGGMGVVAFEQVKRLAKQGHQVTVFTLLSKPRLDSNKLPFNIKYLKAFPRWGNGGFMPQLFWQLKNFDVIQLHYPFFGAQEVLWLAKKLKVNQSKLIIFYHMDASFKSWLVKLLSLKSRLIRDSLFKQADRICCASLDYIQNSKIKKLYQKSPEKFIQIPFGTHQNPATINKQKAKDLKKQLSSSCHSDPALAGEESLAHARINPAFAGPARHLLPDVTSGWLGGDSSPRLNVGAQNDKIKNILFVGSLDSAHYFKGVPILIEAIHKLKDKHLKLIIVGDGNLRDDYERQVAGLNLANQVIFTGYIDQKELGYYYFISDLVVLPSLTCAEAFGLVLIEAKTFGKPTIGSDLPGVRDVVGESGLTVKPGDVDDLAHKIKHILTDKKLYDNFSSQALAEVKEKYNWDKHIQKLNQVYESVMSNE